MNKKLTTRKITYITPGSTFMFYAAEKSKVVLLSTLELKHSRYIIADFGECITATLTTANKARKFFIEQSDNLIFLDKF